MCASASSAAAAAEPWPRTSPTRAARNACPAPCPPRQPPPRPLGRHLELEIERAVAREQAQEMVEHGQAAAHVARARAVERDADAHVLSSDSPDRGTPSLDSGYRTRAAQPTTKSSPLPAPRAARMRPPPLFPSFPALLAAALAVAALSRRAVRRAPADDARGRRVPVERPARTSAQRSRREDRPAPAAHEDGRGRAVRPRRRAPRPPRNRFAHAPLCGRPRSSRPSPPSSGPASPTSGSTSRRARTRCPRTC